jgi:ubiquinone biosynthesis protein COQ4
MSAPAIDTRLRPLTAFRAVRRLIGNPNDTAQVFVILRAMRGASAARAFGRFRRSAAGARVLAERRSLLAALADDARLAASPEDSLGHAYRHFMRNENFSAAGLMQTAESVDDGGWPPEAELFRDRMRVMHDLSHVVTGYGRDPFGELCLMAFTHAQMGHSGMAMIVLMGAGRVLREKQRLPMLAALWEAHRHGRKAHWFAEQDWETLLDQPLETVRCDLAIAPPARYARLAP